MKKRLLIALGLLSMNSLVMAADGKAIYDKACVNCHAAAVAPALKSPAIGDKAAWAPRLAKGTDALLGSIKNGLNAMPPGALCNDCSDDDYKAAIDYMTK